MSLYFQEKFGEDCYTQRLRSAKDFYLNSPLILLFPLLKISILFNLNICAEHCNYEINMLFTFLQATPEYLFVEVPNTRSFKIDAYGVTPIPQINFNVNFNSYLLFRVLINYSYFMIKF